MEKFAIYESEYGFIKVGYHNNDIIFVKKIHQTPEHMGEKNDLTDDVFNQLLQYFKGERKIFDVNYKLTGTDFQIKVWNALNTIPYGETRSYKDIATQVGNSKACRAVGLANNKNPITIIVPCHRVIGSNKKLVGYAGGLEMKTKLLELENNNK